MPNDAEKKLPYVWEDTLAHVLWRTQNAVHRQAQEAVDDLGVTVTQLGLAVHLSELGPLSASDLSRGFRITPQSVTTALLHLQSIGWLTRTRHPVHKRVILHELTSEGERGVAEGRARMTAVNERVLAALSDKDSRPLVTELRRILVDLEGEDRPIEHLWPVRAV